MLARLSGRARVKKVYSENHDCGLKISSVECPFFWFPKKKKEVGTL